MQVNPGSIRREYTNLCFSADGAWLYAGTSSADVVTVNVARASVQLAHPVCSGGVGAMMLNAQGQVGLQHGAVVSGCCRVVWHGAVAASKTQPVSTAPSFRPCLACS